jgi:putative FmdB family regulatory protein
MPIYEYVCRGCAHEFEKLVRREGAAAPSCPSCGATGATRRLSLPHVSSETTKGKAMKAAKQRDAKQATDRVQAQRAYERSHDD